MENITPPSLKATSNYGFITKVLPPKRRQDIIIRQRLIDRLHSSIDKRVQLICASAGYGKSTLVTEFVHDLEAPVCWYSLEESDRDPLIFLQYVIESLRAKFSAFGVISYSELMLCPDINYHYPRIVSAIINEIHSSIREFFILVLEDYHYVEDSPTINKILNLFIEKLPPNCHLILTGRTIPGLPALEKLLSKLEVAGTGNDELAFTAAEIKLLYLQRYGMTLAQEEAEKLQRESEGWITGLLLSDNSPARENIGSIGQRIEKGNRLSAYVINEIYEKQPPHLQQFLLKTSVLSEVSSETCNAILGSGKIDNLLSELERRNILTQLDTPAPCYRYHHLFAEFLKDKLRRESPDEFNNLESRLAKFYEAKSAYQEAVYHYNLSGWFENSLRLVIGQAKDMLRSGKLTTLANWIDSLPGEHLEIEPMLLLWRAQIYMRQGEIEKALASSTKCLQIFTGRNNSEGIINALLTRGSALRLSGRLDDALKECQQALALASDRSPPAIRAEAHRQIGILLAMKGELTEAEKEFTVSLDLYKQSGDPYYTSLVYDHKANLALEMGNASAAELCFHKAIDGWNKLGNDSEACRSLNNLGVLHHFTGLTDLAIGDLQLAMEKARKCGNQRTYLWATTSLADIYSESMHLQQAMELYSAALNKATQDNDNNLIAYINCALGNTYRLMAQWGKAETLIRQAITMAEESNRKYELGHYFTSLGILKYESGDYKASVQLLEQALRLFIPLKNKPRLARTYLHLADVFFIMKKYTKSLACIHALNQLIGEIGQDDFLVAEASRMTTLIRYAASKKLQPNRFSFLYNKVIARGDTAIRIGVNQEEIRPNDKFPKIKTFALGKCVVQVDDKYITDSDWRSTKSKEMFYYLLCHRKGVTKEQIFEALWPDLSTPRGNSYFHTTIYRVKQALYPDSIIYNSSIYQLNRDGEFWFDAEKFQELVKLADKLPQGTDARINILNQAVDMYTGTFLEDFYSEWCETIRRDLEAKYIKILSSIAGYYAAKGDYNRSIELLEKVLSIDRYQQEAYYQLISHLLSINNPIAALDRYREYQRIIDKELGEKPTGKMKDLYTQIASSQIAFNTALT